MNQLNKVAIGMDSICSADKDSGLKENTQAVLALSAYLRLIPTILCGGVGSRLWPVSRELHPKPFIRLADGQSLIQKAYLCCAQLPGVDHLITVTNRDVNDLLKCPDFDRLKCPVFDRITGHFLT